MLPRSSAFSAVIALAGSVACGQAYTEVDFEPLSQAGGGNAQQALAGAAGAAGAASSAGSSTVQGGGSGSAAVPVTALAGANAGSGGSGGAQGMAGSAGAASAACATLGLWQERAFALGERVVSTCKVPYNGVCPADETREFECQPPTGTLGLGWCRDRQPGVVNGWSEAWVMRDLCPVLY